MIDTDSPNYDFAKSKEYFIRNAFNQQMSPVKWWKGHGCLIDYCNPDAVAYFHSLMDNLLDLGIDGWKVDGTDPYIIEEIAPRCFGGKYITYREYADSYYGDFFNYTRAKLGNDRLIMSRPVDSQGPIYLSFSPRYLLYAGWVGDLDGNWEGLNEGITRMRKSSQAGYVNFGSDIAGYKLNGERELTLYVRWFQMGAFCPLMENGGGGNHEPW